MVDHLLNILYRFGILQLQPKRPVLDMTVTVSESELKARLPELIELVRLGEQVLIQHDGEVVACLVQPFGNPLAPERKTAGAAPKLTLDEILAWRHADHAP